MKLVRAGFGLIAAVALAAGGCEPPPDTGLAPRPVIETAGSQPGTVIFEPLPTNTPPNAPARAEPMMTESERTILQGVNAARKRQGLDEVRPATDLMEMARSHTMHMIAAGQLSHQGRNGATLVQRAHRAGVNYRLIGENIQRNRGYDDPTKEALAGWLGSPPHRKTMMNGQYEEIGVSVSQCRYSGTWYFTTVFCLRRKISE